MKARRATTVLLAGFTSLATTLWADWPNPNPTKWVQMPDLIAGVNVNATAPRILADDFPCELSGPITDIHIWGSWLNDLIDPGVRFRLSIHPNIPVGPGGWSVPGPEIWSLTLAPTASRLWATSLEGFYDPWTGSYLGTDTQIWQYNFDIPIDVAFEQRFGNIYWLNIQAIISPGSPGAVFGWKTTLQPWMDKAVWWPDTMPPESAHMLYWDMAFAITTIPEPTGLLLVGLGWGLLVWFRRRSVPS